MSEAAAAAGNRQTSRTLAASQQDSRCCCSRHRAASAVLLAAVRQKLLQPRLNGSALQPLAAAAPSSERPNIGSAAGSGDRLLVGSSRCGSCGAAPCEDDITALLLQRPRWASAEAAVPAGGGGSPAGENGGGSSSGCSSCALCAVARGVLLGEEWAERLGVRQLAALAAGLRAAIGWTPSAPSPAPAAADSGGDAGGGDAEGGSVARPATKAGGRGANAWADAARGRPLTALLRLYGLASRHHIRSSRGSGSAGSSTSGGGGSLATATADAGCYSSCCLAAKLLLAAAADVCRLAPGAVRAELGVCVSAPLPSAGPPAGPGADRAGAARESGGGGGGGSRTSAATVITRGLVAEVRQLLAACPRRLVPRLGSDGRVAKYDSDGVAAADHCSAPAPMATFVADDGIAGMTVAAAALRALAALCRCSRPAARQAYLAGVLDELLADEAAAWRLLVPPVAAAAAAAPGAAAAAAVAVGGPEREADGGVSAAAARLEALRAAVHELYLALAGSCTSAAEDLVTGGDVRGLAALLCSGPHDGIPAALRLRAAQRLAGLADSPSACGPDDFAHHLCRGGGGGGGADAGAHGPTASGVSSSHAWRRPGPLEVALNWMAGADTCGGGGPAGPEAAATGARLLAACIDRARRMGWLLEALPAPPPRPPPPGFAAATAAARTRAPPVRLVPGLKGSVFEAWGAAIAAAAAAAAAGAGAASGPAARVSGCWLDALQAAARGAERPSASAQPWAPGPGAVAAAAGPVVDILLQRTPAAGAAAACSNTAAAATAAAAAPPDADAGRESTGVDGDVRSPPGTAKTSSDTAKADTISGAEADGSGGGGQDARQRPSQVAAASADDEAQDRDAYDEDGLRVVWDSGPPPALAAARSTWAARPLRERLSWNQTSTELFVNVVLPKGTRRGDVSLTIAPTRLTLRLGWCGRVVDGTLHRKVAPSDCIWTLEGETLQVLLAKAEAGHWWRALFEGGEEKGLYQVLSEAVEADEPLVAVEDMDEGGRLLLEELIERQEMIADGSFDLENSFDDFRLVVGDNTL